MPDIDKMYRREMIKIIKIMVPDGLIINIKIPASRIHAMCISPEIWCFAAGFISNTIDRAAAKSDLY